jgi:hypothetical protein
MALIPENDEEYLRQKRFDYEIKQVGPEIHVILKAWKFPEVYIPRSADILIRIMPGYPLTPVDMFWVSPDIKLVSGGDPQATDLHETLGGKIWQRWSRHNQWRAGVDDLRTFIRAMAEEIKGGI